MGSAVMKTISKAVDFGCPVLGDWCRHGLGRELRDQEIDDGSADRPGDPEGSMQRQVVKDLSLFGWPKTASERKDEEKEGSVCLHSQ